MNESNDTHNSIAATDGEFEDGSPRRRINLLISIEAYGLLLELAGQRRNMGAWLSDALLRWHEYDEAVQAIWELERAHAHLTAFFDKVRPPLV